MRTITSEESNLIRFEQIMGLLDYLKAHDDYVVRYKTLHESPIGPEHKLTVELIDFPVKRWSLTAGSKMHNILKVVAETHDTDCREDLELKEAISSYNDSAENILYYSFQHLPKNKIDNVMQKLQ